MRSSEPRRLEEGDDVIIVGNAPPPTDVDRVGVSTYAPNPANPNGSFVSLSDFIPVGSALTALEVADLQREMEAPEEGGLFSDFDDGPDDRWNLIVFP